MVVHHRANGYVAVCIEPDGGCATMLFFEKWSDHHHAAMQARLLAGHDIQANSVQKQEGVGIGLYLARQIISGEGGYIKVASVPGKGSTFSIFLPK